MLVVFCENLPKTSLYFVVGESKLIFFVGQILNYRIVFILGRREYLIEAAPLLAEKKTERRTEPSIFSRIA